MSTYISIINCKEMRICRQMLSNLKFLIYTKFFDLIADKPNAAMTWTPLNNSAVCSQNPSYSGCSPAVITFTSFVVQYFGQSNDNYPPQVNYDENEPQIYDFIIVGAGSAGCVLANRLSEINNWRILLLEAGVEEPLVADVPAFGSLLRGSNIDWAYRTQPEKYACRSKRGGSCSWARGKVMGGSSTINYLMYIRGQPLDYDHWEALGNPGWSFEKVLSYFKKSENNHDPKTVEAEPFYHSTGGYQSVDYPPYTDPNSKILMDAWEEIGYKNIDANADQHIGSLWYQTTTRNGERQSTNGAFIRPIINKRSNLVLKTNAYATKILINPRTKKATGVEFVSMDAKNKVPKQVFATKEVIVSAGAINSPKLLMLSGIGPKRHLNKLGIQVIKNLSVGKNLHDHPTIDGFIIKLKEKSAIHAELNKMEKDSLEYLKTHNNLLSTIGTTTGAGCFLKTHHEKIPNYPNMQFTFDGINVTDYLALVEDRPGTAALPLSYYTGINIRPVLLAPKSRGVLKLNSTDPIYGDPLLYPNYFGDKRDLEILVTAIRMARKLFDTRAFRENGYTLLDEPLPSCKKYQFDSDDYWRCVTMEYTNTLYHYVGTCKMGPRNDPDAVVDAELRVYGMKSLRVVDSSIMPVVTRGNTNAPTIMIAEKISDSIKRTWLSGFQVYN